MANICKKPKLVLDSSEIEYLRDVSQSLIFPHREVIRAQVLLKYYENTPITQIKKETLISRETIYKYVKKALSFGVREALKDLYHSPKKPKITKESKQWVINLACTKPKNHGYASELWTYRTLSEHVKKHALQAGYVCLNKASKATIYRILKSSNIKPQKIRYYLEKRDEHFEEKMHEILLIYKEVNAINESKKGDEILPTITVSVDEKPRVQAIKNTAPDLLPKEGTDPYIRRDYEYQRLGTLSILASLDLHTGHVIAIVEDRHRSKEFIKLLMRLNDYYPINSKIRIILDNHSSHTSKETREFLSKHPNRFVYVHTPKHGSWLNLVETLFGKMARTFLKGIRVNTKKELKERILKGIGEINDAPVVHKWKKFNFFN